MKAAVKTVRKPAEGLRERKRRETRDRITQAAMALFLEQGFDATTVDEIATDANVSKRSFFDYFPTKEDVVAAWQDAFSATLTDAVKARPAG
jgi:AcrR family transcriptional regulator